MFFDESSLDQTHSTHIKTQNLNNDVLKHLRPKTVQTFKVSTEDHLQMLKDNISKENRV